MRCLCNVTICYNIREMSDDRLEGISLDRRGSHRCPSSLYGPATCKCPEETIKRRQRCIWLFTARKSRRSEESDGVDMRRPFDTVTLLCTYACERATDANGGRIHPSGDRRSREKSQITGCDRSTGTIEMWVMQPKEQKFVYTRKKAVR